MARTVDLTPTWSGLMPALLAVLRDGTNEGQAMAAAELTRLAQAMDQTIAEQRAEADAGDKPRPRFEAIIWTHADDGMPLTIGVFESVAQDVAAYAAGGHHPEGTNLAAFGTKLTERQARDYGVSWPARLTYRR